MLDVLYFPKSTAGNKFALCMVDVASRWAYVEPLARVDSASVVKAVEERVEGSPVAAERAAAFLEGQRAEETPAVG